MPLVLQHQQQPVLCVFHAQQSELVAQLSEHGLDFYSIHPQANGLLVQEMLPHACIQQLVKSQHHVQQDIIYNNN